jgi:hypothetical protein
MGMSYEINYIGLLASKTNLTSILTYDAALSPAVTQLFSIKAILADGTNIATGTNLINSLDGTLASACGVTTDGPLLQCIYTTLSSYTNWGWYIYDEPGCPNQSIGYCNGSLAGGDYRAVQAVASYITSTIGDTTHLILGIQTPSGIPSGCSTWVGCSLAQAQLDNLFSCNSQTVCTGWASPYTGLWLTSSYTVNTGWDDYPWCYSTTGAQAGICSGQTGADMGVIAQRVANVLTAVYPSETLSAVGQAFSWYQEGGGGCTSYSLCLYPTQAEEQYQRDEAIYYANAAGYPLKRFFWYYLPDIDCRNTYSGPLPLPTPAYSTSGPCNAANNESMLGAVNAAPFPTSAPVAPPTP